MYHLPSSPSFQETVRESERERGRERERASVRDFENRHAYILIDIQTDIEREGGREGWGEREWVGGWGGMRDI